MNVHFQPYEIVSQGTVTAATNTPTLVPALKIPVARARSFLGNHSATVLIEAGKFPASPSPSAKRATLKPATVLTSACAIAAMLQIRTESEKPLRVPSQSITRPAASSPIAYAVWNAKTTQLYPISSQT